MTSATVTLDMNGREPRTMTLSDPRRSFTTDDWPYGRQRTRATFEIESGRRGERVVRTLVNPKTGQPCKPKKTTFCSRCCLVTGYDDAKTYILEQTGSHMVLTQSNLKFTEGTIWQDTDPKGYAALLAMLTDAAD